MNIRIFASLGKAYLSLEMTASFSFKLASLRDKCAHLTALWIMKIIDSVQKAGFFALPVHYYAHIHHKSTPLAIESFI